MGASRFVSGKKAAYTSTCSESLTPIIRLLTKGGSALEDFLKDKKKGK